MGFSKFLLLRLRTNGGSNHYFPIIIPRGSDNDRETDGPLTVRAALPILRAVREDSLFYFREWEDFREGEK